MELGDLYEEYATMIFRYIYLICKKRDVAEDIVQITFLKAITKIDSFEGKCKVSSWLCQIAKNEYLNYCRKHDRQQSYEEFMEKSGESAHEPYVRDQMTERLIAQEQTEVIKRILHKMKEPYKEVFMLRIYGEYSFNEIGRLFEKNDTWARVTYYRAKEKIKQEIGRMEGYNEM